MLLRYSLARFLENPLRYTTGVGRAKLWGVPANNRLIVERASGVSETFGGLNLTAASTLDFSGGTEGTLNFGAYIRSALLGLMLCPLLSRNPHRRRTGC